MANSDWQKRYDAALDDVIDALPEAAGLAEIEIILDSIATREDLIACLSVAITRVRHCRQTHEVTR
jgi:hypothetical protein